MTRLTGDFIIGFCFQRWLDNKIIMMIKLEMRWVGLLHASILIGWAINGIESNRKVTCEFPISIRLNAISANSFQWNATYLRRKSIEVATREAQSDVSGCLSRINLSAALATAGVDATAIAGRRFFSPLIRFSPNDDLFTESEKSRSGSTRSAQRPMAIDNIIYSIELSIEMPLYRRTTRSNKTKKRRNICMNLKTGNEVHSNQFIFNRTASALERKTN